MDNQIQKKVNMEKRDSLLKGGYFSSIWSPLKGFPKSSKLLLTLLLFLPAASKGEETRETSKSEDRRFPHLTITDGGTISGDSGDGNSSGETRFLGANPENRHPKYKHLEVRSCNL